MDAWNYLDRPCGNSTWVTGSNIKIGDFRDDANGYKSGELIDNTNECEAKDIACPGFESTTEKNGKYFNQTWALSAGSMCAVKVDAEKNVARVIFDNVSFLGVEYEGSTLKIGDVTSFE